MHHTTPYLSFQSNCRQAMTFYKNCLGAEMEIMPLPESADRPADFNKDMVLHARLTVGEKILVMASDVPPQMEFNPGNNIAISIQCENLEEIERLFTAFSDKATIKRPLADAFWGARFGMLTDQFGIGWMFNYDKSQQA